MPVQHELVGVHRLRAPPGLRLDHVQQFGVCVRAREPPVDKQQSATEGPLERAPGTRAGGILDRPVRRRVVAIAVHELLVSAAQQLLPALEEFGDGPAEQEVAIAIEHLPVAFQPERLQ